MKQFLIFSEVNSNGLTTEIKENTHMQRIIKVSLGMLGVMALGFLVPQKAQAIAISTVDIHVSIQASKSVALMANATSYAFGALPLSSAAVAASSVTVINDSGGYVETYVLTGANATSDTGGTNWTLATTTGTNQYALGAIFSNNTPTSTLWVYNSTKTYLSTGGGTCNTEQFGNTTLGEAGVSVSPVLAGSANQRWLWFQMRTPDVSTGTEGRTAKVYISVN